MAAAASGEALCVCLRKILALLEKGEAVEAAGVVAELNAIVRALPPDIAAKEAEEARLLLERCVALESSLREGVLASMRRLGAARKSIAYRIVARRP
jgi:hypothetical protein